MSVSCECCVLSGTGLCSGPINRPEESYQEYTVGGKCTKVLTLKYMVHILTSLLE